MNWLVLLFIVGLIFLAFRRKRWTMCIWLGVVGLIFAATSSFAFLMIGLVLGSVLLGQPLFVLYGAITFSCGWILLEYREADYLTNLLVNKLLELASKDVLISIPFFVLAGEIMTQGSLAERLVGVARALFGALPGGLAVAAVASCVFFAAISGSSPVTVIAIGSIMVPALLKANYPERFSLGLVTSAGSLGILIPPSIPMIVYAIVVGTSTPMDPIDLFFAGTIPGITIGGMLAVYAVYMGIKLKLPRDKFSLKHVFSESSRGFWALMLPGIILGGIYGGVFTTIEAAAASVVYALGVELFIHRDLKLKDLPRVAENSMSVMGALLLIMGLAIAFNQVLVELEVVDAMVNWLKDQDLTRSGFLVLTNVFLLVLGCFMDIMSAILIVAPILNPMANSMEVEPIHMGILFINNLEIGYLTPPLGLNLFVASTLFRKPIEEVTRAVFAPLCILLLGLVLITWVPVLSLGLVRWRAGEPFFGAPAVVETPVDPVTPPPGVKSLQELMQEAKDRAAEGEGEPGRVKSLQELMQEAQERKAKEPVESPKEEPGRVKSLQELMEEAAAKREAAAAPADGGAP